MNDRRSRRSVWGLAAASVLLACDAPSETLPEGKLARVGEVLLGPEDLAQVQPQLGPYAQLRFRGPEGQMHLLQALIQAELLAQEAIAKGLGDDPRVTFAVLEEIAALQQAASMEREVPHAEVAADVEALRAYYEAHPGEFTVPERRRAEGVLLERFDEAEDALDRLRLGLVRLEELGEVVPTQLQARDDAEYPSFHPFLFDPEVGVGDWLAHPVPFGESLFVGRIEEIELAHVEPFDDPSVQQRLVQAVRAPRVEAAKQRALEALRARFPEEPV